MLVVMRFDARDSPDSIMERLELLYEALSSGVGYRSGWLCRSPDHPNVWVVVSIWLNAGSMRRALGAFDVKVALGSLAAEAVDQVSVFEVARSDDEGSKVGFSDRANTADEAGPGRAQMLNRPVVGDSQ